ncbi:BA75_05085T0 [Komagataella pastoris]|uniref:phosphoinositide 5-phosphatase n=1 Tax=Komagataella pastoris TaxID=4922 RepID=A0A1B2JJ91_PICPA|nr:BA75_05085T0 [Komagataella pastoris]
MRVLIHEKTRLIALVSSTHCLLIKYIKDKNQCAVDFVEKESFSPKHMKPLSRNKAHGFLGLINVNEDVFLCVITGKTEVATPIDGETVNKIYNVEFHCLNRDAWDFLELDGNGYPVTTSDVNEEALRSRGSNEATDNHLSYEQNPTYELRRLLSNGSFYYSTNFDLTSTLQSRDVNSDSLSFDSFHLDYMWNSYMMKEVVNFRDRLPTDGKKILDRNGFLTTVIRGFAETFRTRIGHQKCNATIISKQSWKRAGTRYNARGIDDEGYVANFVETELILHSKDLIYAYTEIRGSVPIFWEQDTALVNPKVTITRSLEATEPVFERHFAALNGKYGPVHIVNLLSTKPSEIGLSNSYRKHFDIVNKKGSPQAYLTEFDFHKETGKNYALATKVIPFLEESIYDFDYFSYDLTNQKVLTLQKGVFRTNCLDCLDRTNVVQQVISNATLNMFLQRHNLNTNYDSDLFTKHNTLWADHGDAISQIYTGTNALKSSFTRSGKMGIAGALSDATKSISRMYINNFQDKAKQVTIDTLLGKMSNQIEVKIFDPVSDHVDNELNKLKSQFSAEDDIKIFTGSYNLGGTAYADDFTDWLFPEENGGVAVAPDVVILGFQEVVELTASNILNSDSSKSHYWSEEIKTQLNKISSSRYILLRSEQMTSLLLLFFIKEDKMPKVTQVEGCSKKTGLGGITANKGAVALRFSFGSTTFCLLNSHLAAGLNSVVERNNDFTTISQGIRFSRNKTIYDHDCVIWLGDLNYRVALPNELVRSSALNGAYGELLIEDQLKNEMVRKGAFADFNEMKINFLPTYKYDKGTSVFDTSEKQRVPSWTDRILYRGKRLQQVNYNSVQSITISDHKPIYGTFKAHVTYVDERTKLTLMRKIYDDYRRDPKSEASSASSNGDKFGDLIDFNDASSSSNTSIYTETEAKQVSQPVPGHFPPPPPPPRNRVPPPQPSTPETPPPPGYALSMAPLIPSRANSGNNTRPSSPFEVSTDRFKAEGTTKPVRPMVPDKPSSLKATSPESTIQTVLPVQKAISTDSLNASLKNTSAAPPPPPPRKQESMNSSMSSFPVLMPKKK